MSFLSFFVLFDISRQHIHFSWLILSCYICRARRDSRRESRRKALQAFFSEVNSRWSNEKGLKMKHLQRLQSIQGFELVELADLESVCWIIFCQISFFRSNIFVVHVFIFIFTFLIRKHACFFFCICFFCKLIFVGCSSFWKNLSRLPCFYLILIW